MNKLKIVCSLVSLCFFQSCTYLQSSNLGSVGYGDTLAGNNSLVIPRMEIVPDQSNIDYLQCENSIKLVDTSLVYNADIQNREWRIINLSTVFGMTSGPTTTPLCGTSNYLVYEGTSPVLSAGVSSYSVDGIKSDNDFIIELVLKLTTGEEVKNQAIYISSHSDSLGASAADMTGKAFLMYSPIAVLQGDVLQIPINAGMIKQKLSTNLNSEIDHYNLENVGVLSDLNQDLISEQTFMPSSGQSFEIQLQTPGETKTIKLYNDNPGNPAQVGLVYSDVYFKKSN
jgi:hypothetical protein